MIHRFATLLSLVICSGAAEAAPELTAGAPDCLVYHNSTAVGISAKWTGPCKDGYADGEGKLEWVRLGEREWTYEGGMRGGRFHGVGYQSAINNAQFEGTFVDGVRDGFGISVDANGDRYDGNWKNGLRDGQGKMVYALGGSYDGQWREGKYHGKGTIVYAGGRRAEYEFDQGNWSEKPVYPDPATLRVYSLKSHEAATGSKFKRNLATGSRVPFELSYDKMSDEQKLIVHSGYPLMDARDEPPYPLDGIHVARRLVSDSARAFLAKGVLRILVKVGSDGKATSVTSIGDPHPQLVKFASHVTLLDRYKPAKCAGVPCPGVFQFYTEYGVVY